jgi:hypothetical protein
MSELTNGLSAGRAWGRNSDGGMYVVGLTVGDLKKELAKLPDTSEVCMAVCQKKNYNGGGLLGKLKAVESGADKQVWLKAMVLDQSLE